MPKELVADGSSYPVQRSPLPAEPRTAGAIEPCFQDAANRTEYCKGRVLNLDPDGTGVRRIRTAASIAALKAIPTAINQHGQFCFVTRYGLYNYEGAAADSVSEPWIVKPDDIGGAGRWIHQFAALKGAANGLATLDGSSNLATGQLDYRTVIVDEAANTGGFATTSTSLVAVTDVTKTVTGLLVGDMVVIDVWGVCSSSSAGESVIGTIKVVKPDTSEVFISPSPSVNEPGTASRGFSIQGIYTVVSAGSHTFKMVANSTNGSAQANIDDGTRIRVWVVRPTG